MNRYLVLLIVLIIGFASVLLLYPSENNPSVPERKEQEKEYPWKSYPYEDEGFVFPRDEGRHYASKEWWYINGHLTTDEGEKMGYMVSFFNNGLFIVSFIRVDTSDYYHDSQIFNEFYMSEGRLDLAFGKNTMYQIKDRAFEYQLSVERGDIRLELHLSADKPPMTVGETDIEHGSSYYYSQTDLNTSGFIVYKGENHATTGRSWLDRQWGDWDKPGGWEWFSIRLDTGTDIMAYKIYDRETGYPNKYLLWMMDPEGGERSVVSDSDRYNFRLDYSDYWKSEVSEMVYSNGWYMHIPEEDIHIKISPYMADQEINTLDQHPLPDEYIQRAHFWEGKCTVSGTMAGTDVGGDAYVESVYDYGSVQGDLTVSGAGLTHVIGDQYVLNIEIESHLSMTSEQIHVKFFEDDPDHGGRLLETYTQYVVANKTYIVENIDIQNTDPDFYVIADPDNVIAETDEGNNEFVIKVI